MIDPVAFLIELLEIPSPSGEERKLAFFLKKTMGDWGYDVEIDPAGNVIGRLGEGSPTLLLASHIDTVPGFIPVRHDNDRIFGRGAVDAKGSVAAMVIAGAEAFRRNMKGSLIFAGIVGEEASLEGIQTLLEELTSVDYAIFGEPTGLSRICIASKGRLLLKINVHSSSGHVACSWLHENSIEKAFELWQKLKERIRLDAKSRFSSVIPNLTLLQGGSAPNIVPGNCSLYVDVRFPPSVSSASLLGESRKVIESFEKASGVKVSWSVLSQIEGFRANRRSKVVEALERSIKEIGGNVGYIKKTGTCFMNLIGKWFNIPVVSYGPGDPSLEHTENENILVSEYLAAINILTKTIQYVLR
ncbi:MAG: M20/M25/M40 family metallo-hydrolase [Candidatus Freyarchaeota archaeon]|nr:M20/M25/M40 family metallo-hydrolase [Candidatus Freyrarchaeum guaymaensis]HDO81071.1 M20/M25/M40 family metallo-hydrolase [Candidatus Bathyarchaeota archaeon]